jgi:hypothetical protein
MKPLNFFEKAETGLRMQYLARLPLKDAVEKTKEELNIGKHGVKFMLPVGGRFFEKPLKGLQGTPLKMPFPVCVLEYEVNEELGILSVGAFGLSVENPAKKRVIIVKDTNEYLELFCIFSVDNPAMFRLMGSWTTLPGTCRIYRNAESNVKEVKSLDIISTTRTKLADASKMSKEQMISAGMPKDLVEALFTPEFEPALKAIRRISIDPKLADRLVSASSVKNYNAVEIDTIRKIEVNPFMDLGRETINLEQDYQEEISVVLGFIEALNCNNVKISDLDKRQKRKGTKLLPSKDKYQYKILTIDSQKRYNTNSKNSGITVAERHSPREHLRRGHIRTQHYKDRIKKIWINSTVVNAGKGSRIDKEYLVS